MRVFLLLCIWVFAQESFACSIFVSSMHGKVLVGANEDDRTPFNSIWFTPAENGQYGCVFFGHPDMQAQAGMNEYGLFFDFAAIPKIEIENYREKYVSIADILRTCKTLDEAYEILKEHPFGALSTQLFMADAQGRSMIVNAQKIITQKGHYQISTNFNACNIERKNIDCFRYKIIDKALSSAKEISVEFFRDVLDDVHQEGQVSTQYTNIYDLKNGLIYINLFHNFKETYVLDLKKELGKGFRIKPLRDYFSKNYFAAHDTRYLHPDFFRESILDTMLKDGFEKGITLYEHFLRTYPEEKEHVDRALNQIPFHLISRARIAHDNHPFLYYYFTQLHTYQTFWESKNEYLQFTLNMLHYLKENRLILDKFEFEEQSGYTYMVLQKYNKALSHYRQAFELAEDSWQKERCSKMIEWIRNKNEVISN